MHKTLDSKLKYSKECFLARGLSEKAALCAKVYGCQQGYEYRKGESSAAVKGLAALLMGVCFVVELVSRLKET